MHSVKDLFIVSHENRIPCKIKCKNKQIGFQKDFYISFPEGFSKDNVKRKDCYGKIYFCNVYKNVC